MLTALAKQAFVLAYCWSMHVQSFISFYPAEALLLNDVVAPMRLFETVHMSQILKIKLITSSSLNTTGL